MSSCAIVVLAESSCAMEALASTQGKSSSKGKGGKSTPWEEGKGKEKKGKQSGRRSDKGKYLFRPLANNDLVRPLADNGKDKGKGDKPTDIEEFPTVKKFSDWSWIDDLPEHKQRRAAELMARSLALLDPFIDMTEEEEEEEVAKMALAQEIVEMEHQFRKLWRESAVESEAGSDSSRSSSSSKQARWQRRFRR